MLSLFAVLVTNYYIGFMLCIFSVLYCYIPYVLWLGLIVSGVSLLAVVIYAVRRVRTKRRENNKGIMIRVLEPLDISCPCDKL